MTFSTTCSIISKNDDTLILKAIHGYRETERNKWTSANQEILNKVKQYAFELFQSKSNLLNHVHILDLHEDGYIKLHVDSTRLF